MTVLDGTPPAPTAADDPHGSRPARWWSNRTLVSLAALVLAVLAANLLPLTGLVDPNPLLTRADLAVTVETGWLPGAATLDPNDGFLSQAVARQAADQWLAGEVPYWNHYEGVGAPLAGGMQPGAFFLPFVLLLELDNGLLYAHVLLQVLAAVGTYLLLRRLRIGHVVAVAGGVAFAVSGTYAWLANAVVNPIAFLPWLVLGIELVLGDAERPAPRARPVGVVVIALALAGSLYAGFPEVAYLDALLAYAWAALRLVQRRHEWRRLGDLALGTIAGLALAAPILIAFLTYLPHTDVGSHDGAAGETGLPALGLPALVLPYVYGPLHGFSDADPSGELGRWWGDVGGYLPLAGVGLAIVGLAGRRERGLKLLLVVWSLVCLGKIFGLPVLSTVVNLVPAVRLAAFYRYAPVMVEFAVVVLAALAVDGLVRGEIGRRAAVAGGGIALGLAVLAGVGAQGRVRTLAVAHHETWAVLSVLLAAGVAAALVVVGALPAHRARLRQGALCAVLVGEAAVLFVVPQLSTVRGAEVDLAPVAFLQERLGTASFATLGPIAPNYGSYFGIRSVNINDMPIPRAYGEHIETRLNRNTPPMVFTGWFMVDPGKPTGEQELLTNLAAYAQTGVRYVVARPGQLSPAEASSTGLVPVFVSASSEIFEVPGWRPYYEPLDGSGCRVESGTFAGAVVDCPAPARLLRRELHLPGWTATVNGSTAEVSEHDRLFQAVDLPAGRSTVAFSFRPPGATLSWLLLVAGAAMLVVRFMASRGSPADQG